MEEKLPEQTNKQTTPEINTSETQLEVQKVIQYGGRFLDTDFLLEPNTTDPEIQKFHITYKKLGALVKSFYQIDTSEYQSLKEYQPNNLLNGLFAEQRNLSIRDNYENDGQTYNNLADRWLHFMCEQEDRAINFIEELKQKKINSKEELKKHLQVLKTLIEIRSTLLDVKETEKIRFKSRATEESLSKLFHEKVFKNLKTVVFAEENNFFPEIPPNIKQYAQQKNSKLTKEAVNEIIELEQYDPLKGIGIIAKGMRYDSTYRSMIDNYLKGAINEIMAE